MLSKKPVQNSIWIIKKAQYIEHIKSCSNKPNKIWVKVTQNNMAESTYISKFLLQEQMSFLNELNDHEVLYFSLYDIEDKLGKTYPHLSQIVENLHHKGFLKRIERSKYAIRQFNDPYVLSNYIAPGGIIAYWSALHLHGLTDRFPNKIFVKIPNRKRSTEIFGTKIHFVSVAEYKMIGNMSRGYGDETYVISDVESTILDCFDQPRYAGDWPDLIRAFNTAPLKAKKMITYSKAYSNVTIIKRMGYLAELCQKKELNKFIEFSLNYPLDRYSLFEPGGGQHGKYNARWKLRLNTSEDEIVSILNEKY